MATAERHGAVETVDTVDKFPVQAVCRRGPAVRHKVGWFGSEGVARGTGTRI